MPPYICNICHKSFNSNQHLKQHKNKKNPCYNTVTASIPLPLQLTSNSIQEHSESTVDVSLQNKYLSDFLVTYQKLLQERELMNQTVEDFKSQKNELISENKMLKKKLKAISQIISQSHTNTVDDESIVTDVN